MGQMTKIGKGNTTVRGKMVNGELSVTLYSTEVVNVKGGIVTLKTGGYFTTTTKARMNQASNQFWLGFRVWQEKGNWFVCPRDGVTLPFQGSEISFAA